MVHSLDLARDLVARERGTSAALYLDEAGAGYAAWAQARHDHVLDVRTHELLQVEVLNLMAGLRSLLHDEDFWLSFQVAPTGTETERQLEALHALTRPDLASMFELAGYTVPPPPPVGELIDAATTALAALDADRLTEEHLARAVQRAQSDLVVLLWRAQRQLDQAERPDNGAASTVRAAARVVVRGARLVLPTVVGAGAGAAAAAEHGAMVGAATGKMTERLLEGGLDRLLGSALLIGGQVPDPPDELRAGVRFDPIALHLSRTHSLLGKPSGGPEWSTEAREHVTRLAGLMDAQGRASAANTLREIPERLFAGVGNAKQHLEAP